MDNRQKKIAFLGVLLLGCVATSWLQSEGMGMARQDMPKPVAARQAVGSEGKERKQKTIQVYINGAVREPGIYELPVGSRTTDALEAAGGVREDAKTERVNLAKKLKDGSHVYVPFLKNNAINSNNYKSKGKAKGEAASKGGGQVADEWENFGSENKRINLNTATQAELIALPGIGEAMANRILALRRVKRFQRIEDLLQVRGIGQAKLEKLRPYVKVE